MFCDYFTLTRFVYDAVSLVEPHPGYGPVLAAVADYHPAGDSVAVHHLPHACTQLPHVGPGKAPAVMLLARSSLLMNPLYTYAKSVNFIPPLHAGITSSWGCCAAVDVLVCTWCCRCYEPP